MAGTYIESFHNPILRCVTRIMSLVMVPLLTITKDTKFEKDPLDSSATDPSTFERLNSKRKSVTLLGDGFCGALSVV